MAVLINKNSVAIKPIPYTKVDARVEGGIARIAQRTEVTLSDLVMDFIVDGITYKAGKTKVVLFGDAGFQGWNRSILRYNGQDFVMCPVSAVIGFEVEP